MELHGGKGSNGEHCLAYGVCRESCGVPGLLPQPERPDAPIRVVHEDPQSVSHRRVWRSFVKAVERDAQWHAAVWRHSGIQKGWLGQCKWGTDRIRAALFEGLWIPDLL